MKLLLRCVLIIGCSSPFMTFAEDSGSIKGDFKKIGQDIKKLGKKIGHEAKEAGQEIGKDASKLGHKVADESKEAAAEAKDTGKTIGQRASAAWGDFSTGVKNAWHRITGKSESPKDDLN